jgi:hypothetical protein
VLQILERDVLAVVFQRFSNDVGSHTMEDIPNVSKLPAAHLLDGAVCGLRAGLLEIATNPLELSMPVPRWR